MTIGSQLAALLTVMAIVMALGWRWQKRHANAGIVDVLWSIGVGLGAVWMAFTSPGGLWPRCTMAVLGALWAARLAWHLGRRVLREEEDGRYRHLRAHWQGSQARFFLFFEFQACLVLLFSLPFAASARNPLNAFTPALSVGIAIWIGAVAGESIADHQLAQFRRDPAHDGKTCREGLWRYSRHPNYFFEWLHWFAYVAIAWDSPIAWLAWSGPVVMYVFLRWISGVTFTEAQALRKRGDDYRDYQRTTHLFIPWFPKSSTSSKDTP